MDKVTQTLSALWGFPLVRGISSLSLMRYSTKFLVLVRLAILARFLGPRELGLFGLATLVVSITEVFTETGINLVLLKHPKKLTTYLDTAWTISLVRGVIIAIAIWLLGPWLSRFYKDVELTFYLFLAAFIPLIRGGINPAIISYQQELRFGRDSLLRTILQLVDIFGGLTFVLLTKSGAGLVGGIIASASVELVLSFVLFRTWPNPFRAQWELVRKLYGETKFIIGHGMLNYLTEHADDFLIGRLLGPAGLGLYQTAYKWASAASIDVSYILWQILYPIYAKEVQTGKNVRKLWKQSTLGMAAVLFGAGFFILPFTELFVRIALGEAWLEIVPAIRILFLAGVIKAFINAWNPLSLLADTVQHFILVNAIIILVMLSAIWVLAPRMGIEGASYGLLLGLASVLPYAWWITQKSLKKLGSPAKEA